MVIVIIPHGGKELLKILSVSRARVQPGPLEVKVPIVVLIKELSLQDVILHADILLHASGHHNLKPGYRLLCSFDFQMLKQKEGFLSCRFPQL